jgi:hypothetical protein
LSTTQKSHTSFHNEWSATMKKTTRFWSRLLDNVTHSRRKKANVPNARRLRLEHLEAREMLTTLYWDPDAS